MKIQFFWVQTYLTNTQEVFAWMQNLKNNRQQAAPNLLPLNQIQVLILEKV